MTINEKAAYLKGLMEGLQLDTEKAEGKMIAAIVDLLGDVTKKLTNVEDTTIAISDELDEIEEDLDAIEDFIMDYEDDEDYEDYDEDEEEEFDDDWFEVECPNCDEVLVVDEEALEVGSIKCPSCGTEYALDLTDDTVEADEE